MRPPEPVDAADYIARGEIWRRQGDFTRALSDYNRALALEPGNVPARYVRRDLRLWSHQYQDSLDDANELVKLLPSDPLAYADRGVNHMLLRQWPEALADFRQAIALGHPREKVLLNIWVVRQQLGDTEGANAELTDWLATRPHDHTLVTLIARHLLGQVSEEKLLDFKGESDPSHAMPDLTDGQRSQYRAWYYIGMKKRFLHDRTARGSLERCCMNGFSSGRDNETMYLAHTELDAPRPQPRSPQEALLQFVETIPLFNDYTMASDDHSVTLRSKKSRDQTADHPEAVLEISGPIASPTEQDLEERLRGQIDNIRRQVSIGPYLEYHPRPDGLVIRYKNDRVPDDNVVHYIELIEGLPVGLIQYWIADPHSPAPPCTVQTIILQDHRQYTFTLTTFVPTTQLGYRMDEHQLIKTLIRNGKL